LSFSKRNDTLFIDKEALSSLAIVQEGLLTPVNGLMGEDEAKEVDTTGYYKGLPMPFSFILAPKGKINEKNIQQFKKNQKVTLICDEIKVGELVVDEIFKIDPNKRVQNIYATTDKNHPAAKRALNRLGEWAVSGEYKVEYPQIKNSIEMVKNKIKRCNAKRVSGLMLGANPLNRAHERVIRQALDNSDILVIFLIKPFTNEGLDYKVRKESLEIFVENFLPNNRVLIVPFENSYIFAGSNELILDATVAKNYGCTKLIVGRNHRALGMIYNSQNEMDTVFDTIKDIGIDIVLLDEYVYCDMCKTLVNTNTCPHGQHHHIHYHYKSLMELIRNGILPPPILVRKEISAHIISSLYPNRIKNLQETYDMIFLSSGLLEQRSEKDFYIKLLELYQTSSLT
jgi:sulfate adenylyltransferase